MLESQGYFEQLQLTRLVFELYEVYWWISR